MKTPLALRASLLFAALGSAVAAPAIDVQYDFSSYYVDLVSIQPHTYSAAFSFAFPSFVAAPATIPASALRSASITYDGRPYPVTAVAFEVPSNGFFHLHVVSPTYPGGYGGGWDIPAAALTSYGTFYARYADDPGTLSIAAAPEPSALALLGVPALALLRGRRA